MTKSSFTDTVRQKNRFFHSTDVEPHLLSTACASLESLHADVERINSFRIGRLEARAKQIIEGNNAVCQQLTKDVLESHSRHSKSLQEISDSLDEPTPVLRCSPLALPVSQSGQSPAGSQQYFSSLSDLIRPQPLAGTRHQTDEKWVEDDGKGDVHALLALHCVEDSSYKRALALQYRQSRSNLATLHKASDVFLRDSEQHSQFLAAQIETAMGAYETSASLRELARKTKYGVNFNSSHRLENPL